MRRLPVLLALLAAGAAVFAPARVKAQNAPPPGYTVMPAGWNLISTATAGSLSVPSASPRLYTLQPGDTDYEAPGWDNLHTGYGYWALFNENTAVRLPPSQTDSYSVTAPAGQWVFIGNPSTSSSARVSGADQVYVYSALTGFRSDTVVPVGYGAMVYSTGGGQVTIAVVAADRTQVDFGACCTVGAGQYGGKAHVDILDDSPYALLFGVRQLDSSGAAFSAPATGNYSYGLVAACSSCDEYQRAPSACRSQATTRSIDVAPGTYLIRLTTDAPRVADIILVVPLQADTHYYFCRWVGAGRS